jgi:hypothetical protein
MNRTCIATVLAMAPAALAGGPSASVEHRVLRQNQIDFVEIGDLELGDVAFGITTPIALNMPGEFRMPDTELASYRTSDLSRTDYRDFFFTHNDDADADHNLSSNDSYGSLYRLQPLFATNHSIAIGGSGTLFPGDTDAHNESGDYLLTTARVRPTDGVDSVIPDTESGVGNDTIGTADLLNVPQNGALASINRLNGTGGDLDYYRVDLAAGDIFTMMTAPLRSLPDDFDDPDTLISVFDASGSFLFDDDDAGGDLSDFAPDIGVSSEAYGSAIHLFAEEAATFYIAIGGFVEGSDPIGDHSERGLYGLAASRYSTIPSAGSLAIFGLAGLGVVRRRR